jgi:hypothetical protein
MDTIIPGEAVQIKPGCGFWDVTIYPVGGHFRRVGASPRPVVALRVLDTWPSGDAKTVLVSEGPRVFVVNAEHLEEPK